MDCDKALEMMSLYIDLELNKEEQEKLFEHIDCCEQCRQEFEMLKDIVGTLNKEEFLPLPCDYHEELMAKVNDIKIENVYFGKNGKDNGKKWKKYGSIAAAVVLVISVSAVVRNMNFSAYNQNETTELTEAHSSEYNGKDQRSMPVSEEAESNEYAMDEEKIMPMDFGTAAGDVSNDEVDIKEVNSNVEERKKIKTSYIALSVENFEEAVGNIREKTESNNGYVENYNSYVYQQNDYESLKAGNITLRIDKNNYEQVKVYIKSLGEVTLEDESINDITSQYIDTQGRLKAKRVEEERLLELLGSAKNIQDIIAIEERIGYIRSEIESYQTTVDNWDKQVDLSTINVELREERTAKVGSISSDFGTKIKDNFIGSVNMFVNGIQTMVLMIASISLQLVVIAVVVAIVTFIIIKKKKA